VITKLNIMDQVQPGRFKHLQNRLFQRWFFGLGMIAMLGALMAVPMTSTYVFAKAVSAPAAPSAMADMPCHKSNMPAKHCPNCPQKICPDMGTCMVKCFQSLSLPISVDHSTGIVESVRLRPASSQMLTASLIPPLLRPPSV
jgi:hypothetical protein